MSTERDTKFLGFAKLLWPEISHNLRFFDFGFSAEQQASIDERIQEIIAQRAYDLVAHTLHEAGVDEDVPFNDATTPADIPDLTEWPTPPASAPQGHSPD